MQAVKDCCPIASVLATKTLDVIAEFRAGTATTSMKNELLSFVIPHPLHEPSL